MKPIKPLKASYFQNYSDSDSELSGTGDRSYSANWRDCGFNRFEDYLKILASSYTSMPELVFECGSADGSVIRELIRRGIHARGCEFSASGLLGCDPEIRKLIARGNVLEVIRALPDNSYDCVYETSAQYIPEKYLESYFRNIRRIVKRDLVILVHTKEDDPNTHEGQLNHWHNQHWIDLIESCGFVNAYAAHPTPFYFRKI